MHDPQTTSIIEMKLTFTNNIKVIYRVSNNKKKYYWQNVHKIIKSQEKGQNLYFMKVVKKRTFDQQCM